MRLEDALFRLNKNNKIRLKGNIHPFFYVHIFKEEQEGRTDIGICKESGQVEFIEAMFSLVDIKSGDWEVVED